MSRHRSMDPAKMSAVKALLKPASLKRPVWIGMRSEDPSRIWERRAPLTPDAVYDLVSTGGVDVEVTSCTKRVFKDEEYRKAGANIVPFLHFKPKSAAYASCLVLGIKEPPVDDVHNYAGAANTIHMMFSHTAKGQSYNMPLLSKFLVRDRVESIYRPQLVDYELIVDPNTGKRTVAFGWYAGAAGVFEALSSLGHYYLERGIATPFLYTPRPHTRPSLEELRMALTSIGQMIQADGLPKALGPCIIGVTGSGQVAQGALSLLNALPIEMISAQTARDMVQNPSRDCRNDARTVYVVHVKPEDYLYLSQDTPPEIEAATLDTPPPSYDRKLYYEEPGKYESLFYKTVAPYLSLLINGTGWSPGFPRLMRTKELEAALSIASRYPGFRACNIADISCDPGGGLEFMTKASTISSPFYTLQGLDPRHPPVQIMSVDILPASVPLDASKHFSGALTPYVKEYLNFINVPRTAYPEFLRTATIAKHGLLEPRHQWLYGPLASATGRKPPATNFSPVQTTDSSPTTPPITTPAFTSTSLKKILMLGSGMVAQPAVDMIAERDDVELIIASNNVSEMVALAKPHTNVKCYSLNFDLVGKKPKMGDTGAKGGAIYETQLYESLVGSADVVISLLPAAMHPQVAKTCIKLKTHLVTASYVSKEMAELNNDAAKEGVLLLNEIGLDPGIDHCSARDLIQRLKNDGKTIESFTSFCGGLPAPEFSHVPLRYKFSWRPQGVLLAALNEAHYRLSGKRVAIEGTSLLSSSFPYLPITPEFDLEGIPNRDSLSYIADYDLHSESLRTFVRGTLRYPGFSQLMNVFAKIGLLKPHVKVRLDSWRGLIPAALKSKKNFNGEISSVLNPRELKLLNGALQFLDLNTSTFTNGDSMPPLPQDPQSPLDLFAYLLAHKLRYKDGERDMVVLSHEIKTRDGKGEEEVHTSTLIAYGTLHHHMGHRPASAMARTVGYPVAIAALLVVDDAIALRGVQRPLDPQIYEPVLERLDKVGIRMVETTRSVGPDVLTVEDALKTGRETQPPADRNILDPPDIED